MAPNKKRKTIPSKIKDNLLLKSMHRCCLCPEHVDTLDVHHIDPISKNGPNSEDNLIAVCPTCHAKIHRQKKYTPNVLQNYKERWEKLCAIGLTIEQKLSLAPGLFPEEKHKTQIKKTNTQDDFVTLIVELDKEINEFNDEEKKHFLNTLKDGLNTNNKIVITKVERGSIKVSIKLNLDDAIKFIEMLQNKTFLKSKYPLKIPILSVHQEKDSSLITYYENRKSPRRTETIDSQKEVLFDEQETFLMEDDIMSITSLEKPVGSLQILVHLHRNENVTINNLIKDAGLNQRTTYSALSKLQDRGLIYQEKTKDFLVWKHYRLTEKGKKIAEQLEKVDSLLDK